MSPPKSELKRVYEDVDWDNDQRAHENLEQYIDIFLELQIESIMKQVAQEKPQYRKKIEDSQFYWA